MVLKELHFFQTIFLINLFLCDSILGILWGMMQIFRKLL